MSEITERIAKKFLKCPKGTQEYKRRVPKPHKKAKSTKYEPSNDAFNTYITHSLLL